MTEDPRPERPFKVLYFVASYKNLTGSQRSLLSMVASLPAYVERKVVFPGGGRAAQGAASLRVPYEVLQAPASLNTFEKQVLTWSWGKRLRVGLFDLLPYTWKLFRLIRRENPQIVHCNDVRSVLLAGPAARLARKPVVWHVRSVNVLKRYRMIDRATHRLSTMAITVADALKAQVEPGVPVRTVYNGVDLATTPMGGEQRPRMKELLLEAGLDADATTFLVASSFVPYKGHHHLLQALAELIRARPELEKRIAVLALGEPSGDDQNRYRDHLRHLGRELGIDSNVIWLGWQDEAKAWMASSDVVVVPTVERERFRYEDGTQVEVFCAEGLPRVILEAMSVGRLVIATDVAGVREALVDEETGLVVPPSDVGTLRNAMCRMIENPEIRKAIGASAQSRASLFTIERTVEGTLSAYRELLCR